MKYTAVESSMIDLVGYDPESQLLEVRFVNSGDTYAYEGISKAVYKGLIDADSKGRYMLSNIIDCYPWYKIGRRTRRSR